MIVFGIIATTMLVIAIKPAKFLMRWCERTGDRLARRTWFSFVRRVIKRRQHRMWKEQTLSVAKNFRHEKCSDA